jgi:hypothetical protein
MLLTLIQLQVVQAVLQALMILQTSIFRHRFRYRYSGKSYIRWFIYTYSYNYKWWFRTRSWRCYYIFRWFTIRWCNKLTITVVSASVGDVVYVKNGVYRETLPLRVPAGVTVQGESLRGTEIRPASGNSTQVATFHINIQVVQVVLQEHIIMYIKHSTTGTGDGIVVNVTTDGSSTPTVTVYHGGYGYAADNITISGANIGGGATTDLVLDIV